MNELFRIKDALANIGKIVDKTDNEFTDSLAAEVYEANDALNALADKLVFGNKQTDSGLSKLLAIKARLDKAAETMPRNTKGNVMNDCILTWSNIAGAMVYVDKLIDACGSKD